MLYRGSVLREEDEECLGGAKMIFPLFLYGEFISYHFWVESFGLKKSFQGKEFESFHNFYVSNWGSGTLISLDFCAFLKKF